MKKNKINAVFNPKKKGSKKNSVELNNQPPKNMVTVRALIKIIEPYSARKKSAKPIAAYSTLNPETSSDSASGKSKGARFVSARIDIKNIKNNGKNGTTKKI
jgi:hypothetical protein